MTEHSTKSSPTKLLNDALTWHNHGGSLVPVSSDGSKKPALETWKKYQSERADETRLQHWFSNGSDHGLGVICGAVSGNLEMFEFEGRAITEGVLTSFVEALDAHALTEVWTRLNKGYLELSPSGGIHLFYRIGDGPAKPNTKLARRLATAEELAVDPDDKRKVLIETRGEGGFTVLAPTPGTHHPSGRPWRALVGSPETIPLLTVEERDQLYAVATLFDRIPLPPQPDYHSGTTTSPTGATGLRPGDDYNQRAEWSEILLGWTRVRPIGSGWAWRRPGKKDRGISATTGQREDKDRLYVFSSSTEFEPETPYDKFGAYTLLHHNGDFKAAGKALRRAGYGDKDWDKPPRPTRSKVTPIRPGANQPSGGPGPESDGNTARDTDPEPEESDNYPRYTDAGNATALIEQYGERLRFDCDRGRWLLFTGHQWRLQPPRGGEVRELAKNVAHQLSSATRAEASWQHRSLSTAGISATLASAETIPSVSINTNKFDADPYLLGTPGGVVDLRTGTLRPGRPQDMVSRSTTVTPESGPVPAVWTDFLNTTFSSDPELIGYVQRLFGLALIGEPLEQILPFFYGPLSANGKSTLLKTMQTILGLTDDGYATSIAAETLMVRRNEGHPTELAVLAGRRLVVASELEDGQQLAEARVKMITRDDVIQARFLFGQPFTFTATHLLIMVGNEKPTVTTGGDAMWRRLKSVPFDHQVPPADRIASSVLRQRFLDVGGHILTWMINGALDYLDKGIRTSKAVTEATKKYANEEDSIARFVDERTVLTEAGITVVKALRGAYEGWCAEVGDVPVSAKRLTQQLAARFDVASVLGGGGVRTYRGILLLGSTESADGADEHEKSDSQPDWG